MRLAVGLVFVCLASALAAQGAGLRFGAALEPYEREALKNYLRGDSAFSLRSVFVAKARLNSDDRDDLIVLSKSPATCRRTGCEARILFNHINPLAGAPGGYQGALARRVRTIALGPLADDMRMLQIDGRLFRWDGKSYSAN